MGKEQIHIDLITKHLSGETTQAEQAELDAWIKADPQNSILFDEYKKTWSSLGKVESIVGIDVEAEWKEFEEKINTTPRQLIPQRNFTTNFVRIAAVLLIGLITTFGVRYALQNTGNKKVLSDNMTVALDLPDGSSVTLNKNSTFRYPRKFRNGTREVFLSGEAYFEVRSEPDQPFIITTDLVRIEVLGTSFNVKAYQDNEKVEVVVNSGTVALRKAGPAEKKVILKAGNRGTYNKLENALEMSVNEDENYLSWKTMKFVFTNAPLEEITRRLEDNYELKIRIPDESLRNSRLTVTFDNQTPEAVMNVLRETLDLQVKDLDGTIILTRNTDH